jgi:hypothetical protein
MRDRSKGGTLSTTNGNENGAVTRVALGSELKNILQLMWLERGGQEKMANYEKDLKVYLRRLGKREEIGRLGSETNPRGFTFAKYGKMFFVGRPTKPGFRAYYHSPYDRSPLGPSHAQIYGLLANSRVNREIRPGRVADYQGAMQRGEWRDLLSDPITVTHDGEVVNGQHRLAAASEVDWTTAPYDPKFLVVWGVSADEALHADLARRTPKDQATIFSKLVAPAR